MWRFAVKLPPEPRGELWSGCTHVLAPSPVQALISSPRNAPTAKAPDTVERGNLLLGQSGPRFPHMKTGLWARPLSPPSPAGSVARAGHLRAAVRTSDRSGCPCSRIPEGPRGQPPPQPPSPSPGNQGAGARPRGALGVVVRTGGTRSVGPLPSGRRRRRARAAPPPGLGLRWPSARDASAANRASVGRASPP